jgi:hypothetical protein
MADWRKLALDVVLADNVIDDNEVRVLRKHLYEDGKIDRKEVDFLVELRTLAQRKNRGEPLSPAFERFFVKAIEDYILEDGEISTTEAKWLQNMMWGDGKVNAAKIDATQKRLLTTLKNKATNENKTFNTMYQECMAR